MSQEDFIENYATYPELAEATLIQGGLDWDDIEEMGYDAYDAGIGSVPGMIYYSDTVPFAKDHHLEILQALQEFEEETGTLPNKPSPTDETQYFNWLAWFAWENTMSEVLNYMEL